MKDIIQNRKTRANGLSLKYDESTGIRFNNMIRSKREGFHILIGKKFLKRIQFHKNNEIFDICVYYFDKEYRDLDYDTNKAFYYL